METTLDTLNEQTGLLDEFFTPTEAAGLLKFKTPRPVYDARGVHKLDPPANQDIRRRDRVNAPHEMGDCRKECAGGTGPPLRVVPPGKPA